MIDGAIGRAPRCLFVRFLLRFLLVAVLLAFLAAAGLMWDVIFNQHRLVYLLLGRDQIVAACRPPLDQRLRKMGFEPSDIAFDDAPDISVSSSTGKTLSGHFTFADGATGTRVDGVVTCSIRDGHATVEVTTETTPLRAT